MAAKVEEHEDRLRRLEEQARQDSRASSRPPSRDPPKTRAERRAEARAKAKELMRREGERRKAGGQLGHRGAGREREPEDRVEIVDHYPDACSGCGREFTETERRPRRRFGRHQVCELPPISVIVTEPLTAGTALAISTLTGANCAGRTCSATSAACAGACTRRTAGRRRGAAASAPRLLAEPAERGLRGLATVLVPLTDHRDRIAQLPLCQLDRPAALSRRSSACTCARTRTSTVRCARAARPGPRPEHGAPRRTRSASAGRSARARAPRTTPRSG